MTSATNPEKPRMSLVRYRGIYLLSNPPKPIYTYQISYMGKVKRGFTMSEAYYNLLVDTPSLCNNEQNQKFIERHRLGDR